MQPNEPFMDGEDVHDENIVKAMMTAVAWINEECTDPDCPIEIHPFPVLELHAHTQDGKEHSFLIPPILAMPLLESVMRLAQQFVGEATQGSYAVPDSPEDINWEGDKQ